jgi:hypothetical protein
MCGQYWNCRKISGVKSFLNADVGGADSEVGVQLPNPGQFEHWLLGSSVAMLP